MYLSKVHIPWQQTKNPYPFHQALWRLFPGYEEAEWNFLFRVEQIQNGICADVLLQPAFSRRNPMSKAHCY